MPPVTGKRSVRFPTVDDPIVVIEGDCIAASTAMDAGSVDAIVTDPPYGLEFMGKEWDSPWKGTKAAHAEARVRRADETADPVKRRYLASAVNKYEAGRPFQAWCETWAVAALRVLKPGGYMLAFGGTRTYHRLACAVEDAGFEVRDCLMWMYGTGFPKGQGCLKPAWEPILLARKPGKRVLPLGIDECRIGTETIKTSGVRRGTGNSLQIKDYVTPDGWEGSEHVGRYPANVLHDGSDEVLEAIGDPARFFYCAKASKKDRGEGNTHPTVKPVELMRWCVRLVARPGGLVLDPFGGSGTTAVACVMEGRRCILVEREPAYVEIALRRVTEAEKSRALARGFQPASPPVPITGLGRSVPLNR